MFPIFSDPIQLCVGSLGRVQTLPELGELSPVTRVPLQPAHPQLQRETRSTHG